MYRIPAALVAGSLCVWIPQAFAQSDSAAEAAPADAATATEAAAPPEEAPAAPADAAAEAATPANATAAAPAASEAAEAPKEVDTRADGEPAQLDDLVVTATKRPQSVRDIPQSITAFRGDKLEAAGKLNLYDFIQESPGVTAAQGSPGFTRLTFRGITTDTNPYAGTAQPVGIFIGDVAFTDPYIANIIPDLNAFDLAGVQVLKGPQGTLFGGSALSGAIRYELEEPVLDTWQARGFGQYVSPTHGSPAYTEGIAVNVPIPDTGIAARLDYIHREYPGVTDNLRTGEKDVDAADGGQVRAQVLWKPGNWKFRYTHITQDFSGDDQLNKVDAPEGPRATNHAVLPEPSKNDFGLDSLEATYDFDSVRLTSLSSQVHRNAKFTDDLTYVLVGTPPPGYPASAAALATCTDNSRSFSQELRVQSIGDGPFNWLLGGYYFDYKLYFRLLIDTPLNQSLLGPGSLFGENPLLLQALGLVGVPNVAAATSLLDGVSNAKSNEKAVFGDFSYKLWDELTLSAGGRYYQTEVSGGFTGAGLLIAGNENDGLGSSSLATIKERGFNPKFSATWKFNPHASTYLAAAKGFRFGGIQDIPSTKTNGVPPTFKSDTLWNYELGLRTNWLDNTLQADLTLFYIDYKNPIITQSTQGLPIAYNTNVSAAISRGVEGSIVWNTPLPGLSWFLAGGLTDAHITKEFTASNGTVVKPGAEMPGAAREQYSSSLQYVQILGFLTVAPSVSYVYVGKGYGDITHLIEINGYGSLNAGLVLGTLGIPGTPTLALNMSNITDVTRATAGGTGKAIVTQQQDSIYLLNAPRTLTARLSFEF